MEEAFFNVSSSLGIDEIKDNRRQSITLLFFASFTTIPIESLAAG